MQSALDCLCPLPNRWLINHELQAGETFGWHGNYCQKGKCRQHDVFLRLSNVEVAAKRTFAWSSCRPIAISHEEQDDMLVYQGIVPPWKRHAVKLISRLTKPCKEVIHGAKNCFLIIVINLFQGYTHCFKTIRTGVANTPLATRKWLFAVTQ